MNILLLRPDPGNERFGLGPFFRVEPLGLEYIGAALRGAGHEVFGADLRFGSLAAALRRARPRLVGISCMHALEYDRVLEAAREVRRALPEAFVLVGGHAAAAYSRPLETDAVDAICVEDGEEVVPAVARALGTAGSRSVIEVPGLRLRTADGWISTAPLEERTPLDVVAHPARDLFEAYRQRYHCLLFKPVWLIETARGCPFRCNFCSVWQLYGRSFRERSISSVVEDFASVGPHVFVGDDLFFNHAERSLELARALRRANVRKRWILVQTRTDLVCRRPELLEAWRPLAEDFDLFFGLEAASDEKLAGVVKDTGVSSSIDAATIAREHGYGVTGNFLVDPNWAEEDFRQLWDFVALHGFQRAGYTILTPLPGTELYEQHRPLLEQQPWFKFDMHHVLWEPRLGARRFFELYAETWRRSILNTSGEKDWIDWMRQVRPSQIPYLARVLLRTQRMMKASAYLKEHRTARPRPVEIPGEAAEA